MLPKKLDRRALLEANLAESGMAAGADVYGIMRDAYGDRSEEEYAWYIKLGVLPGEDLSSRKWFLSFHPTREIRLANHTVLRTTVLDYDEEDDE